MRYIDSGHRSASQALGTWLKDVVPAKVAELRFQTGFFGASGISPLLPLLDHLRLRDGLVRALIGSNDSGTGREDVAALFHALGLPRAGAKFGVCAFGNAFFHPKVVHIRRLDGEQAAYVGSANLTASGVQGLHIEAGVLLDTTDGDSEAGLEEIASAIDAWFEEGRAGCFAVDSLVAIDDLVKRGILAKVSKRLEKDSPSRNAGSTGQPKLPGLKPLIGLPAKRPTAGLPGASPPTKAGGTGQKTPSGSGSKGKWKQVWQSKGLVRRDLTIPKGQNTHQTGSMLLKKGDWEGIDQRHYFRDKVFDRLAWRAGTGKRQTAHAQFELQIRGREHGVFTLSVGHNANTTSRSYEQGNSMTSLRWGDARPIVAREELLGCVMELWRDVAGGSRFRVVIRDP